MGEFQRFEARTTVATGVREAKTSHNRGECGRFEPTTGVSVGGYGAYVSVLKQQQSQPG